MNSFQSTPLLGIHHITALASDPQRNVTFYTGLLGLRLVKKTVNFDAPDVYHLYFGDAVGTPGTLVTFFPFPHAGRGVRGNGELAAIAFRLPAGSEEFWIRRLSEQAIRFDGPEPLFGDTVITLNDPDGLRVELVFTKDKGQVLSWQNAYVPSEHSIHGLFGATMRVHALDRSASHLEGVLGFKSLGTLSGRHRYSIGSGLSSSMLDVIADPALGEARSGAGSIHHIAWRVAGETAQLNWLNRVASEGIHTTDVVDRLYFRSLYYREPGGVLFEIATDAPGFTVDEAEESLGSTLRLPLWLEESRPQIQRRLPPLEPVAQKLGVTQDFT